MYPRFSEDEAYLKLQEERHKAEVQFVVKSCYPDSNKASRYFSLCSNHRPLVFVEQLRADTREAWRAYGKAHRAATPA